MKKSINSFEEMNSLSEHGIPFFFIIDFLKENIIILQKSELNTHDILIKFPHFQHEELVEKTQKEILWESFLQDIKTYQKGFEIIQNHLRCGNSYLINYTCKSKIKTNLSLKEIYTLSDAKYKVYYNDTFTFFSPETFIEIKDNHIFTYPMKGTIDASKENAINTLKQDKKELA